MFSHDQNSAMGNNFLEVISEIPTKGYLHILAPYDRQSQRHLFHTMIWTEDPLVAVINNEIDDIVKSFQGTLEGAKERFIQQNKSLFVDKQRA